VLDYRGIPHVGNGSLVNSTIDIANQTVVLDDAGDTGVCAHTITRSAYRKFASTYLDTDLVDMDADEKAYAVRLTVNAITDSGSTQKQTTGIIGMIGAIL